MMKDYYGALGIPDTYAYFDHEHAYHRPGLRWHPDLNGGEVWAVEHFQLIENAYSGLKDGGYSAHNTYVHDLPIVSPFRRPVVEQRLAREKCKDKWLQEQSVQSMNQRQTIEDRVAAAAKGINEYVRFVPVVQTEEEEQITRQDQWQRIADALEVDAMLIKTKMTPKIQYLMNLQRACDVLDNRVHDFSPSFRLLTKDQREVYDLWGNWTMNLRDKWDKIEDYSKWEEIWWPIWKEEDIKTSIQARREAWRVQQAEMAKEEAKRQEVAMERRKHQMARSVRIARAARDKAMREEEAKKAEEAAKREEKEAGGLLRWC